MVRFMNQPSCDSCLQSANMAAHPPPCNNWFTAAALAAVVFLSLDLSPPVVRPVATAHRPPGLAHNIAAPI